MTSVPDRQGEKKEWNTEGWLGVGKRWGTIYNDLKFPGKSSIFRYVFFCQKSKILSRTKKLPNNKSSRYENFCIACEFQVYLAVFFRCKLTVKFAVAYRNFLGKRGNLNPHVIICIFPPKLFRIFAEISRFEKILNSRFSQDRSIPEKMYALCKDREIMKKIHSPQVNLHFKLQRQIIFYSIFTNLIEKYFYRLELYQSVFILPHKK